VTQFRGDRVKAVDQPGFRHAWLQCWCRC
jgi:hypothetical protein